MAAWIALDGGLEAGQQYKETQKGSVLVTINGGLQLLSTSVISFSDQNLKSEAVNFLLWLS